MTAERPKKIPTRRGVKIALGLSLALNLLVLGLIVGLAVTVRQGPGGERGPGLRALGLGPIALALTREDRQALRGQIARGDAQLRAGGETMALAVAGLTAALRAESFDRAAASVALDAQRESGAALQARGHEILLDHLSTMSLEDRIALAERIDTRLQRFAGHRHGQSDSPDRQ